MRKWRYSSIWLTLVTLLSSVSFVLAQANDCPAIIEEALAVAGDNCADLGRNSACYGYNRVDATFITDLGADFFSQVADIAQLSQLQQIRTAALNTQTGEWGVAVLNVQANLPNTLPGQGVILMLVGDAELTNAVSPDQAAPDNTTSVTVQTLVPSNLRSGPNTNNNVILSVPAGTALLADAYNSDRTWLRVVYEGQPGWIARSLVDEPAEGMDALPIADENLYGPMQAFFLRTGIGQPACEEAPPDSLFIQGPRNITVKLNVNGVDLEFGSTLVLRVIEPGNVMEIIVLDGDAQIIDPFTGRRITIPAGFRTRACFELDELGQPRFTCGFISAEPIPPDELSLYNRFEAIPSGLLHYAPEPLTYEQILQTLNAIRGGSSGTGGGSATSTCSSLRLTSPLGQVNAQAVPFFWDAAEGATRYDVRIYNANGQTVASASTTNTTATLDPRAAGGTMYWEVIAYNGDTVICSAVSGNVVISGFTPTGPFSANWYCDGFDLIVSWQNASPGDTVQIVVYYYSTPYTYSGVDTEGSVRIYRDDAIWYGGSVTTSSGFSAVLNGTKSCYNETY